MGRATLTDGELTAFRERTCDVALELFAANGYEAVTMRAISAGVGCSPMTPYRYFPDGKREILAQVRTDAFRRFADAQNAIFAEPADSVDRVERLGLAYVQFALEHPAAYRIMFEMEPLPEEEFPELAAEAERARTPVLTAIDQTIAEGRFHGDAIVVAQVLWAGLHGLVALHMSGQLRADYTIEDLLPHLVALLRAGALATNAPVEHHTPASPVRVA